MDYHDVLAYLGVGSAHPGGFAATVNFLSHFPITPGSRVLEVGCGTGRTSCYLAELGCEVSGLDVRPHMLEKAEKRAQKQGICIDWIEGDAQNLPFAADQFDVVFAESVTVFTNMAETLREYHRVLIPGGTLYDREMMAMKPVPPKVWNQIASVYGARGMPSLDTWLDLLRQAGFFEVEVWSPTALSDDIYQFIDTQDENEDAALSPASGEEVDRVEAIKAQNQYILTQYEKYHGYGVFIGRK